MLYRGWATGAAQGARIVHTSLINKIEQKGNEISLSLDLTIPSSFNSSTQFLQNSTASTFNSLFNPGTALGYPTTTKFADYVLIYVSSNSYFFFSTPNGEQNEISSLSQSQNFLWVGKWNGIAFSSPYLSQLAAVESTFIQDLNFVKIQSLGTGINEWFPDSAITSPISFQGHFLLPFSLNDQLSFSDGSTVSYTCMFFMNTKHFSSGISSELAEYSSTEYMFHATLHYPSMTVLGSSVPSMWNAKMQDALSKISASLKESDLSQYENHEILWEDLPLPLISTSTLDYFLISISPQFFSKTASVQPKNLKLIHVWGYSMLSVFLQMIVALFVAFAGILFVSLIFVGFFIIYSCITSGFYIQLFLALKKINNGDFFGAKKILLFPFPLFTEYQDIRQSWLNLVENLLISACFVTNSSDAVKDESKTASTLKSDRKMKRTTQFYFSLPLLGYLSQNNYDLLRNNNNLTISDLKLKKNSFKAHFASVLTLQIGGIADFLAKFSKNDFMTIYARLTEELSAIIKRRGGELVYFNTDKFQILFLQDSPSNPIGALNAVFSAFEIVKCFEYLNICCYERGNTDSFLDAQIGIATSYVGIGKLGIEGIKLKECSVFGKRAFFSRVLAETNDDFGTQILVDSITAKILNNYNKKAAQTQNYPDFEERFPFGDYLFRNDVFFREEIDQILKNGINLRIPKFSGVFKFRQVGVLHVGSKNRSKKNLESFFQVKEFDNENLDISMEELNYDKGFAAYMEGDYEKAEEYLLPEDVKQQRRMKKYKNKAPKEEGEGEDNEEKPSNPEKEEDDDEEEEFDDTVVEIIIESIKSTKEKYGIQDDYDKYHRRRSDGQMEELDLSEIKKKLFQVVNIDEKLYREDKVVEL